MRIAHHLRLEQHRWSVLRVQFERIIRCVDGNQMFTTAEAQTGDIDPQARILGLERARFVIQAPGFDQIAVLDRQPGIIHQFEKGIASRKRRRISA